MFQALIWNDHIEANLAFSFHVSLPGQGWQNRNVLPRRTCSVFVFPNPRACLLVFLSLVYTMIIHYYYCLLNLRFDNFSGSPRLSTIVPWTNSAPWHQEEPCCRQASKDRYHSSLKAFEEPCGHSERGLRRQTSSWCS